MGYKDMWLLYYCGFLHDCIELGNAGVSLLETDRAPRSAGLHCVVLYRYPLGGKSCI